MNQRLLTIIVCCGFWLSYGILTLPNDPVRGFVAGWAKGTFVACSVVLGLLVLKALVAL
jgi:hypothetical protein